MMKYPKKQNLTAYFGKCNIMHINYLLREEHIKKGRSWDEYINDKLGIKRGEKA